MGSLKKLMDMGVVRKSSEKNEVGYEFITGDRLRYEMMQSLLLKLLNKEIDEDTFLKLVKELER
jgi:predicted transcriptional regulator